MAIQFCSKCKSIIGPNGKCTYKKCRKLTKQESLKKKENDLFERNKEILEILGVVKNEL